jgi:peptidyl-dipeptidase Dcp
MKNANRIFLLFVLVSAILVSCNKEPEVNKSNPFYAEYNTPFDVPPFEKIMAKHYMPAFEKGMEEGRVELTRLLENKKKPTFKNTIEPFSNMGDLLTRVAYVFFGISSACTNDSERRSSCFSMAADGRRERGRTSSSSPPR